MTLPFTIRTAGDADLEAIWRVHRTAIEQTCATRYGPDVISAWVERLKPESYRGVVERGIVVIAEDNGATIGFGQLDLAAGEIQAVYVRSSSAKQSEETDAGSRARTDYPVSRQLRHSRSCKR